MKHRQRPLILLVNDDGVFSPGMAALCEAVLDLGELLIVAPSRQQTSMGRSYPKNEDLGIINKVKIQTLNGPISAYSITSSPAYAVAYAVKELADRLPDLCVSGINYGENLGATATYSGTVGAAMQAADFLIPSIAISRPAGLHEINAKSYATLDWTYAKQTITYWASRVLAHGVPFDAPLLNINVPDTPVKPSEYKYTRQGCQDLFVFESAEKRDFTKPYQLPTRKLGRETTFSSGSDLNVVCTEHLTSVTPMACDLTFRGYLEATKETSPSSFGVTNQEIGP